MERGDETSEGWCTTAKGNNIECKIFWAYPQSLAC